MLLHRTRPSSSSNHFLDFHRACCSGMRCRSAKLAADIPVCLLVYHSVRSNPSHILPSFLLAALMCLLLMPIHIPYLCLFIKSILLILVCQVVSLYHLCCAIILVRFIITVRLLLGVCCYNIVSFSSEIHSVHLPKSIAYHSICQSYASSSLHRLFYTTNSLSELAFIITSSPLELAFIVTSSSPCRSLSS